MFLDCLLALKGIGKWLGNAQIKLITAGQMFLDGYDEKSENEAIN